MDVANGFADGGIHVGTEDMSEFADGWCTYNGDHISMYDVNAGSTKTMVQMVVRYVAETTDDDVLSKALLDVLDTPVSPEAQRLQLLAAHRLQHAVRRLGCAVSGERGRAEVNPVIKNCHERMCKVCTSALDFLRRIGYHTRALYPARSGNSSLGGIKNEQQQW